MPHFTFQELLGESRNRSYSIPEQTDIVVVGAGMSGLYTAWRLLHEDADRKIIIIDRLNRTGGRLDSDLVKLVDETVKEEQGGMRFTFDYMDNLMSLFLMLKDQDDHPLADQIVPFPMDSGGNNRLYFRGRSFTNKDSVANDYAIWSELYNLEPAEQGINPKTIINTVFNRILAVNPNFTASLDKRTPKFWQDFRLKCKWKEVLLKDWSLWNLLIDQGYSNECITLLYRLLGFNGTFLSETNAGEAYQLLEDFPSEPDFKTLKEGFSTLPNALVEEIGMRRIFLNTNLEAIDSIEEKDPEYKEGYRYKLEYTNNDMPEYKTVLAKKAILALPRLALEKLFIKSNAFNKIKKKESRELWNTLQTTTNQPLLKINLYYENAWWGNNISGQLPVAFGPNFSDLPLGSVYPFYSISDKLLAALEYQKRLAARGEKIPEDIQRIIDSKYAKLAALTIYCDYLNINFWKALQNTGPLFTSEAQSLEELKGKTFPASKAVVKEATRFFKLLFSIDDVPQPILTSARIWSGSTRFDAPSSEQFGYGVHQWALHAEDDKVMEALTEPLENLYTCGEAYSDYQGWVEGALRSANLVLNKFGLKPISEVYQGDYKESPSEAIKKAYRKKSNELIYRYFGYRFDASNNEDSFEIARKTPFALNLTCSDQ